MREAAWGGGYGGATPSQPAPARWSVTKPSYYDREQGVGHGYPTDGGVTPGQPAPAKWGATPSQATATSQDG